LPHGMRAVLQIAAFACLIASAVALGHQQAPQAGEPAPRAGGLSEGPAQGSVGPRGDSRAALSM
jgi:hypothetical protein